MPADGTILNGDTNSQKRVAQPERFAYVTGGASGIGKGVVQMLAKRKYSSSIRPSGMENLPDHTLTLQHRCLHRRL